MLAPVPPQGAAEEQNPLLARVDELERGLRVEAQKREALEQRLARLEAGEDGALTRLARRGSDTVSTCCGFVHS